MKRIILAIAAIVFLLILIGSLWGYFAFLSTKPLTKEELAELTPDWSVITHDNWSPWFVDADATGSPKTTWNPAASFNAWLETVPDEDKAWPILTRAREQFADEVLLHDDLGMLPTDPPRWDRLQETLASSASDQLLAQLKAAYAKPVLGCGLSDKWDPYQHAAYIAFDNGFDPGPLAYDPLANTPLMEIMQGWVGRLSVLNSFLESRAAYEFEHGNIDEFVEIVLVIMQSTKFLSEFPSLIGQLVEISTEHRSMGLISWAMEYDSNLFTQEHLTRFEEALADQQGNHFLWQAEALLLHDTFRRLSNKRGSLTGRQAPTDEFGNTSLGAPVHIPDQQLKPSLQQALSVSNNMLESLTDASRIPWDPTLEDPEQIFANQSPRLNAAGKLYLGIYAPATSLSSKSFKRHIQQTIGLRTAIALHRHQLRHGQFPSAIDTIDADLLVFNPIDAFTGNHLKYAMNDFGPVIYSVGDDRIDNAGDQLWRSRFEEELGDDGIIRDVELFTKIEPEWISKQEADQRFGPNSQEIQGDWILFPIPFNDPSPLDFDIDVYGNPILSTD